MPIVSGGGGGTASIRFLGPYTVSFNTPNIATDYVKLADLAAGVCLTRIVVVITAVWNAGGHFTLVSDASATQTVWTSSAILESQGAVNAAPTFLTDLAAGGANLTSNGGAVAQAGSGLWATIDSAAASGSLNVYAVASV